MKNTHPTPENTAQPGQSAPQPDASPDTDPVIEINDRIWERHVEKEKLPVAVMFYSPSCPFCHQMEPSFRNFAREYREVIRFFRINIMTNLWTAERYGVRSTPTFKFFCDGKPVQEIAGAIYPALLKRLIEDFLLHGRECAQHSTAVNYEITGYG